MPSSLVHYIFADMSNKEASDAYLLGSQGPDPFFYSGYLSICAKNAKNVRQFGTFLHKIDPYKIFSFIVDYINENRDHEELLKNFTHGLLSHYILDRATHPFIFYKTGFPLSEQKYSYAHSRYESILDVVIGTKYNYKLDYTGILKLNDHDLHIVSKMFFEMANALEYKNILIDDYYDSVKTMRTASKLLNPKNGGIRTLVFNKCMKTNTIKAMSHPFLNSIDPSIDYLNENRNEWFNCVNNVSKGNTSFIDLMDKAKLDYYEIIKYFDDSIIDSLKKSRLDSFIKEKNHNGFKVDSELKFFDHEFSEKIQNS